ncbi:MAG: hypothetical protein A2Z59_05585 [Nitrospinae bacterium RIFCSPLOWO2_02_39_17]|nr:MAG: hypothetical protein A2Z59_05585 [Nitrospinae bacterium RIFCSPLOWO2_02_39_17]
MNFIEFKLTSDALYLGERTKGNIFKPCVKTIPFSQISGALNAKFGLQNIKAVGYLAGNSEFNKANYLIYSPQDRTSGISKLPLQVEFLTNVLGKVFVAENNSVISFSDRFEITMGGLRSKGFGVCILEKVQSFKRGEITKGVLNVRIPMDEKETFNIEIKKPIYGYLFKPVPNTFRGNYILSIFEGSEVVAPKFLLRHTGR